MKLNYLSQNHIKGGITIETAVCSTIMIILFSLFFSITGYCKAYLSVKEFIDIKAKDNALAGYITGIDVPGLIPAEGFLSSEKSNIKNLIILCENWGEEVHLRASYTYASLVGDIRVLLHSYFTKWTGDISKSSESVWLLPPAERGKLLESIFGGGLPEFFPVLDAYDNLSGHAASIFSVDTTLDIYDSGNQLKKVVTKKADELKQFKSGKYDEVHITEKDIDSRELILIIPENPLNDDQLIALDECFRYVLDLSINLTIKRYQKAPQTVSVEQTEPWSIVE